MLKKQVLSLLARDSDIDPSRAEDMVDIWVEETKQVERDRIETKTYSIHTQPSYFNDPMAVDKLAVSIKGQTARPKLGGKNSKLINQPNETLKDYEVHKNLNSLSYRTARKMSKDPEIRLGVYLLEGLISSLRYKIQAPDELMQGVIREVYKGLHESTVRQLVKVGVREGFTFGEKVMSRPTICVTHNKEGEKVTLYEGTAISIKYINWIDPAASNLHYYKSRDTGDISFVRQYQIRKGKYVTVKRDRLVWFALDKEFNDVFGNARFESAKPYWYYGDIGFEYMLNGLQKFSMPYLECRYPSGSSRDSDGVEKSHEDVMVDVVQTMVATGALLLPNDRDEKTGDQLWSVNHKETKSTGIDSFDKFFKMIKIKKLESLGIVSGLLTGDSNNAEVDALIDLFMVIIEQLVEQVEAAIKKDIIETLVEYNFGPDAIHLVDFKIARSGLGQRRAAKEILINMMRISGSMQGYNMASMPDPSHLLSELDISEKAFEDVFVRMQEDEGSSGLSPLARAKDQEASNDPLQRRVNPTERERPASANDVRDGRG